MLTLVICSNMFTFFFFAFYLESIIGHWQFLVIYFVSMIVVDLSIIKNRNNSSYSSLGASGAISAVVFSDILYNPLSKLYIMFIPIGIPAIIYAGFVFNLLCLGVKKTKTTNVNHSAHLWGLYVE